MVVGGRYGLGSKDFTPAMAKAVFDNLLADKPRDRFTVGITGMLLFLHHAQRVDETSFPIKSQ